MGVHINCKHIDKFYYCKVKPKQRYLLFWKRSPECPYVTNISYKCDLQERYSRSDPSNPPPQKVQAVQTVNIVYTDSETTNNCQCRQ